MHAQWPLPNDSDLARAIAVLARVQQDAVCNRQQVVNQHRSLLREYYPAVLEAFAKWADGLCRPEVRSPVLTSWTATPIGRAGPR